MDKTYLVTVTRTIETTYEIAAGSRKEAASSVKGLSDGDLLRSFPIHSSKTKRKVTKVITKDYLPKPLRRNST